jgi:hypothetical protein
MIKTNKLPANILDLLPGAGDYLRSHRKLFFHIFLGAWQSINPYR